MSCKSVFFSVEMVFQHLAKCVAGAAYTGTERVVKDDAFNDGIIFKPTNSPEARVEPFVTLVPKLLPTTADERYIFRAAISSTWLANSRKKIAQEERARERGTFRGMMRRLHL
jgi:hypothetical protein